MADPINVDLVLFRDGENLILQTRSSQPVHVRLAVVDTAVNNDGKGNISALLPEGATEADYAAFLDQTKNFVENYVQNGSLDTARENIRLRQQINALSATSGR
jgi:hypothetical protein